jgi:acyl carrier protein
MNRFDQIVAKHLQALIGDLHAAGLAPIPGAGFANATSVLQAHVTNWVKEHMHDDMEQMPPLGGIESKLEFRRFLVPTLNGCEDRVKHLLIEHLGVPDYLVTGSADIANDLGADSLDQVELVMAVEEEFGVDVPDDVVEGVRTVADMVKVVTILVENAAARQK